jgi:hypothetical protein
MYGGWNLVVLLIFAAFCGQSIGFWPFDVLAAKDGTEDVYGNSNAKRIAIIGMSASFWDSLSVLFDSDDS